MSAEGKKKRGISGMSNAKSIPFRYGGSKCSYSTRINATTHPRLAGSAMINACKYGFIATAVIGGKSPVISERMDRALERAMDNCTSTHLV